VNTYGNVETTDKTLFVKQFDDEENYEILGETLALPPRFTHMRQAIENHVRHIDTKRSHIKFEKEY